jgi:hypothetical protein
VSVIASPAGVQTSGDPDAMHLEEEHSREKHQINDPRFIPGTLIDLISFPLTSFHTNEIK